MTSPAHTFTRATIRIDGGPPIDANVSDVLAVGAQPTVAARWSGASQTFTVRVDKEQARRFVELAGSAFGSAPHARWQSEGIDAAEAERRAGWAAVAAVAGTLALGAPAVPLASQPPPGKYRR